jgi:hypothetical protein
VAIFGKILSTFFTAQQWVISLAEQAKSPPVLPKREHTNQTQPSILYPAFFFTDFEAASTGFRIYKRNIVIDDSESEEMLYRRVKLVFTQFGASGLLESRYGSARVVRLRS